LLAHKKGLNVVLDIAESLPTKVKLDPVRFKQVVTNLLSYSVKFTDKGEVKLSLNHFPLEASNSIYRIEVSDTGIGISSKKSERIFKAFGQGDRSTTRKYGGSGLGLVITNELLRLMNSELELSSEEGKGSTFSFSLKLENEALVEPQNNGLSAF
jgi:signal transduction histidine kinase